MVVIKHIIAYADSFLYALKSMTQRRRIPNAQTYNIGLVDFFGVAPPLCSIVGINHQDLYRETQLCYVVKGQSKMSITK